MVDSSKVPPESQRLDQYLSTAIGEFDRWHIWDSANRIIDRNELEGQSTGLALGYVQSGKTTQMMALTAAARDRGFKIVIAFLGSTNLLLDQNAKRFKDAFAFETRVDYVWHPLKNPTKGDAAAIKDRLSAGRVLFVPVLKHSGRIGDLTAAIKAAEIGSTKVLVIDDEADQSSLNTKVNSNEESKTYAALKALRNELSDHLYVQYTATPYAPLLLAPDDHLAPEFVEFLQPGSGYTGGKEFFIDHASTVIRNIPNSEEHRGGAESIKALPFTLINSIASFVAGAAVLHAVDTPLKPISMMIHSSHAIAVQKKYFYLIERLWSQWKNQAELEMPPAIADELQKLYAEGVAPLSDQEFAKNVKYVFTETAFHLVNSATDVQRIPWNMTPFHILVGGNKLDRGYTVEGLTITYMNRPSTKQIDTLEQRARAFGYRGDLMPFCKFFGTTTSINRLRGIVATEYDLRARLGDWIDEGNSPADWSKEIGLLIPQGMKPTRDNVIEAIQNFNTSGTYHYSRKPSLVPADIQSNRNLVKGLGLFDALRQNFGRMQHRHLTLSYESALGFLQSWTYGDFDVSFEKEKVQDLFERIGNQVAEVEIYLMQLENSDSPRIRKWVEPTGFVNLAQGSDVIKGGPDFYFGDRNVPFGDSEPEHPRAAIQVHRVRRRDDAEEIELLTLGVVVQGLATVRKLG